MSPDAVLATLTPGKASIRVEGFPEIRADGASFEEAVAELRRIWLLIGRDPAELDAAINPSDAWLAGRLAALSSY